VEGRAGVALTVDVGIAELHGVEIFVLAAQEAMHAGHGLERGAHLGVVSRTLAVSGAAVTILGAFVSAVATLDAVEANRLALELPVLDSRVALVGARAGLAGVRGAFVVVIAAGRQGPGRQAEGENHGKSRQMPRGQGSGRAAHGAPKWWLPLNFIRQERRIFSSLRAMLAEAALLVALTVEHGSGTSACLEAAKLERAVERRLKRRVFVAAPQAQLTLRVVFTRRVDDIAARIELSSADGTPRGTRTLVTAGHCSALDDSLALSVALLVDEPPDPEPLASPEPAAAPAPTAAAPSAKKPDRVISIPDDVVAPREPWHARFGVSAAAAWGQLPGIRPVLALHLTLAPRGFWPVVLTGDGFWPKNAERDDSSGARFQLFRAGLSVCPALLDQPAQSVAVCVGQRISWLSVEGYGFDHDERERRLGYALSLGGEGRQRLLGPVSVRGYAGAEVPLVRDRFTSGGRNAVELFQPSPVGVIGEIGLEAALW
jgi:hypothetical protein